AILFIISTPLSNAVNHNHFVAYFPEPYDRLSLPGIVRSPIDPFEFIEATVMTKEEVCKTKNHDLFAAVFEDCKGRQYCVYVGSRVG
ncbi:hypothetical protein, partial [Candidatus Bandiella numerosa]